MIMAFILLIDTIIMLKSSSYNWRKVYFKTRNWEAWIKFNQPLGVTLSSSNLLYIADGMSHRIQVFNGDRFQFSFRSHGSEPGQLNVPCAIALSSTEDQLFVSEKIIECKSSTLQGNFLP